MTDQKQQQSVSQSPLHIEHSETLGTPSSPSCGDKLWAFTERWRIGDWIVVLVFFVIYGILTNVRPHRQIFDGYNDPSIQYPLVDPVTIPNWLLIVIAVIIPIVLIIVVAIVQHKAPYAKTQCMTALLGLLQTLSILLVIIEGLKRSLGQPRPNFIAYSGYVYNTNTNTTSFTADQMDVDDAFMAFPSGHSGVSFGCLGFFCMYLLYLLSPAPFVRRIEASKLSDPKKRNQLWKVLIAMLPIIVAFFIAITRVRDYFHHTQDILAGAVIGLSCALISFYYNFYHIAIPDQPEHIV